MNVYAAACVINLGLMALIAFTVYCTGSAWPLWALLFLTGARLKDDSKDEPPADPTEATECSTPAKQS